MPGVQLAAFITGGQSLQLGTLNGPPGSIKAGIGPGSDACGEGCGVQLPEAWLRCQGL